MVGNLAVSSQELTFKLTQARTVSKKKGNITDLHVAGDKKTREGSNE